MISLDDFQALQRRVENAKQQRDRAVGAVASLRERLRREYGVEDVDEATRKLTKLERREETLADEYLAAKKTFEAKYAALLEKK